MSSISEEAAAILAASTDPAINPNAPTFFDKIVSKQIPANIIYEDSEWFVFNVPRPHIVLIQS